MIVSPQHTALSRIYSHGASGRPRGIIFAALLALIAATLTLPGAAFAANGGVSVSASASASKKKARGAASDGTPATRSRSVSKPQLKRAQALLRLTATGTHDTATRKVVKRFQRYRGITSSGIVDLPTYLQIKDAFALLETGGVGVGDADTTTPSGGGATTDDTGTAVFVLPPNVAPITPQEREILDKIAQCESNGDPKIVSANGLYRGKYQFDRATWKTVGGTGDPAAASEEEQDQRAAILLRQRGTAPWPVCGQ